MAGACECGEPSGCHKMRGISWLAKKLLASQEGLCSTELCVLVRETVQSGKVNGCFGVTWCLHLQRDRARQDLPCRAVLSKFIPRPRGQPRTDLSAPYSGRVRIEYHSRFAQTCCSYFDFPCQCSQTSHSSSYPILNP